MRASRRAIVAPGSKQGTSCRAITRSKERKRTRARSRASHQDPERDPDHEADRWAGLIKARVDGFELECTTVVRADDRERLEHLCKYVLRPPLADRRLRLLATGELALELDVDHRSDVYR